MPLTGTKEDRFKEFGEGSTFRRTAKRYGKKRANKQRVAVVLSSLRRGKGKRDRGRDGRRSGR
ncbi:MAG: hypothetical protein KGL39_40730 [Patescibacteria group bacterium]|nr:hypothetical protein [Patescibacteria group bacterium]